MTLNDVMAVTLRYITEFGKHALQKTICGGIYAKVLYFLVRVQCRRKESSHSLSSPNEFLVFARCYGEALRAQKGLRIRNTLLCVTFSRTVEMTDQVHRPIFCYYTIQQYNVRLYNFHGAKIKRNLLMIIPIVKSFGGKIWLGYVTCK